MLNALLVEDEDGENDLTSANQDGSRSNSVAMVVGRTLTALRPLLDDAAAVPALEARPVADPRFERVGAARYARVSLVPGEPGLAHCNNSDGCERKWIEEPEHGRIQAWFISQSPRQLVLVNNVSTCQWLNSQHSERLVAPSRVVVELGSGQGMHACPLSPAAR